MTRVELRQVSKTYLGKKALRNVSITIESGDFAVILGPQGAGKTTLLRIIAGVEGPDKGGRIYFDGEDVTKTPPQKRNVGAIFQVFALYPNLTAYENIASPLRAKKMPEKEIDERVKEYAEKLRIAHLLDKYPNELSGGEAQRVALARALVKKARVYLMDEPLTNLDYKLREEMRAELKRILAEEKATIIYATPDPEEAVALGKTLFFLYDGQVLQTGPVEECFEKPANTTAARFMSRPPMNLIAAKLITKDGRKILSVNDRLQLDVTNLNLPEDEEELIMGIRPHNIYLSPKKENMIPIEADLELQEIAGSEMTLKVRWGDESLDIYVPYVKPLKEEKLTVYLDSDEIFIFSKKTGNLIDKYKTGAKEVIV